MRFPTCRSLFGCMAAFATALLLEASGQAAMLVLADGPPCPPPIVLRPPLHYGLYQVRTSCQ